jgi:hypothetical protein
MSSDTSPDPEQPTTIPRKTHPTIIKLLNVILAILIAIPVSYCLIWVIVIASAVHSLYIKPVRMAAALNVYPDAEVVYVNERGGDAGYGISSYFYATEDSLEEVLAYYEDQNQEHVFVEGRDELSIMNFDRLEDILHGGGIGMILGVHETTCRPETFDDCITTILLSLDEEPTRRTLIVISFGYPVL